MISKIRIFNLKSIKDSGDVDIKPLTVLIGKNSSGKSTFLRLLPLLKQSFRGDVADPILWYGPYVDFGNYHLSLNSNCDRAKDHIAFELHLKGTYNNYAFLRKNFPTSFAVRVVLTEKYVSEYRVTIGGNEILYSSSDGESYDAIINENLKFVGDFRANRSLRSGLPRLKRDSAYSNDDFAFAFFDVGVDVPRNVRDKFFDLFEHGRHVDPFSIDFLKQISIDELKEKIRAKAKSGNAKRDIKIDLSEDEIAAIAKSVILNNLSNLNSALDNSIRAELAQVTYFQPLRARGDRYYRVQGLRTTEIDSNGENGPMFLLNLNKSDKKSFENWCFENFGFAYSVENEGPLGDNVSVNVIIQTNRGVISHNMTDVGFGYSQIFPIILSLWNGEKDSAHHKSAIYVIEQPELHLHPAFQKRFLETLFSVVSLAEKKGQTVSFVLETHSETIINYIGYRISQGINPEEVNLICCQKDKDHSETHFEKMRFNNEGLIENWPVGFFTDEE